MKQRKLFIVGACRPYLPMVCAGLIGDLVDQLFVRKMNPAGVRMKLQLLYDRIEILPGVAVSLERLYLISVILDGRIALTDYYERRKDRIPWTRV